MTDYSSPPFEIPEDGGGIESGIVGDTVVIRDTLAAYGEVLLRDLLWYSRKRREGMSLQDVLWDIAMDMDQVQKNKARQHRRGGPPSVGAGISRRRGQQMSRLGADDSICPGCTQLRKDCAAWERLCTRAVYCVVGVSAAAVVYAAWSWIGAR
jgi:hypothetical protein